MVPQLKDAKFPLGRLVLTTGAYDALTAADMKMGLFWHMRGEWGAVSPQDRTENHRAVRNGGRILSAYLAKNGTRFWIVTEADRSATTVLLPEEG